MMALSTLNASVGRLYVSHHSRMVTGSPSVLVRAKRSLAVVTLDKGVGTDTIASTILKTLRSGPFELQDAEALRAEFRQHQVVAPGKEVAAKFSKGMPDVTSGIRSYFYESYKQSIQKLLPIFNMGLQNLDMLAHRPDLAAQVYEAGTVLLRAYLDTGDKQNADAVATLLARHFPTHKPSTASAPVEVVQFVEKRKAKLAQHKSTLDFRIVDGTPSCRIFINGTPWNREEAAQSSQGFAVDPTLTYRVKLDCGRSESFVWRVKPRKGAALVIPITDRDPFGFTMSDGQFASRSRAEQYLRCIAFWTQTATLIGVTQAGATSNSKDGVLFVRLDDARSASWSDGANRETIRRLLVRVLPELEGQKLGPDAMQPLLNTPGPSQGQVAASSSGSGSSSKVGAWVTLGAGVVAAGVGGGFLYAAELEARRLACSPVSSGDKAGCEDVTDAYPDRLGAAQFDEQRGVVSTRRIVGASALVLGAALGTVGVILLTTGGEEGAAKQDVRVGIAPRAGGAEVGVGWAW